MKRTRYNSQRNSHARNTGRDLALRTALAAAVALALATFAVPAFADTFHLPVYGTDGVGVADSIPESVKSCSGSACTYTAEDGDFEVTFVRSDFGGSVEYFESLMLHHGIIRLYAGEGQQISGASLTFVDNVLIDTEYIAESYDTFNADQTGVYLMHATDSSINFEKNLTINIYQDNKTWGDSSDVYGIRINDELTTGSSINVKGDTAIDVEVLNSPHDITAKGIYVNGYEGVEYGSSMKFDGTMSISAVASSSDEDGAAAYGIDFRGLGNTLTLGGASTLTTGYDLTIKATANSYNAASILENSAQAWGINLALGSATTASGNVNITATAVNTQGLARAFGIATATDATISIESDGDNIITASATSNTADGLAVDAWG